MNCIVCGTEIPAKRIEILPNTKTCVNHSTAERFAANVVQHGNIEDDGYQDVEVIRNPKAAKELAEYHKQLGSYGRG